MIGNVSIMVGQRARIGSRMSRSWCYGAARLARSRICEKRPHSGLLRFAACPAKRVMRRAHHFVAAQDRRAPKYEAIIEKSVENSRSMRPPVARRNAFKIYNRVDILRLRL